MFFIVRYIFSTAVKKDRYQVYEHFSRNTGNIFNGKCTFKAGTGGYCKHVAVCLCQLFNFLELDINKVPGNKTCTDLLLKQHVPGEKPNKEAFIWGFSFSKGRRQKR